MSKTLFCQRCEKEVEIFLSEAGPHVKASCMECGLYIKFLKQTELTGEKTMNEIFYELPESEYGDGVFLEEYKNQIQLIAGNTGRDGTNYKKWAFPQNKDRKPTEKAIPVSVNLGSRYMAIDILKKMVAELEGVPFGVRTLQEKAKSAVEQKSLLTDEDDSGIPF